MTEALQWLDRTLANCPTGGCALYVRHAARESGTNVVEHVSKTLDPLDQALATEFGKRLTGRIGAVLTAKGTRSLETANWILRGANPSFQDELPAPPIINTDIGDPSAFIKDEDSLMATLKGIGPDQARQVMLDGILREREPWVPEDIRAAARSVIRQVVESISPGMISVLVAPSVPIAATVALALGREKDIWHMDCPLSLEGAVFFRSAEGKLWLQMGHYSGRAVL